MGLNMKTVFGKSFADENGRIHVTIDENTFLMNKDGEIRNAKYWLDQNEKFENLLIVEQDPDGDWYAQYF